MNKLQTQTKQFERALKRLIEVLKEERSMIVRDAAIKRFEFTFDIAWKSMKEYLEEKKGVICKSPKDCIRKAYENGLIQYDDFWISLVDSRNLSSHIYKEEMAEEVYEILPKAQKAFQQLLLQIKKQV
jgi:nucleotidyltransferase substrate binding protein (TIGR01987 family)